nr:Hypothetical protein [Raoultella ornithinolytica]
MFQQISFLFCCKLMKALREIPQGYRGVPGRKSRSALFSSVSCLTCTSWHYSNSPKNRKTAINPRHYWLHGGSEQKKVPLRIWFYPQ